MNARSFIVTTFVIFMCSCTVFAQPSIRVTRLGTGVENASLSNAEESSRFQCLRFYQNFPKVGPFSVTQTAMTLDPQGGWVESTVSKSNTFQRPESFESTTRQMIDDMVELHGYTSPQKAMGLLNRDRNLDPRRVTYFSLESDSHKRAGLRIFDASDRVSDIWGALVVEAKGTRTIIEESAPETILERSTSKDNYLWELGLVNTSPDLQEATSLLMSQVAFELDARYNQGDYLLGSTESLRAKNFRIVIQTRATTIPFFENYGFRTVLKDGKQNPLSSGLLLMQVSGEEFLKNNFQPLTTVSLKGAPRRNSVSKLDDARNAGLSRLTSLMSEENLFFADRDQVTALAQILNSRLDSILQNREKKPQGQNAIQFLISYFIIMKSLPPEWRGPNWRPLYELIKTSFYMDNSISAIEYFARHLAKIQNQATPAVSFGQKR